MYKEKHGGGGHRYILYVFSFLQANATAHADRVRCTDKKNGGERGEGEPMYCNLMFSSFHFHNAFSLFSFFHAIDQSMWKAI
ncbi:hypothetical protein F5I97DRAFT_1850232 [Phlebopus sp. FC_14]|nr:hypothetical protein F5I97DRAFT_1850232 [Phlebopus sp. FC_14]